MRKYLSIFKISFQQEFVYRLNFIMWRIRNVIQILLIFFLWDSVFSEPGKVLFGYDRARIITYVFGLIFIRSVVLSIRSIDVAGEISRGEFANYLIKPVSYFKYWFTRDLSSKALNILFAIFEFSLLFIILQPSFFMQTNLIYVIFFLLSLVIAILIYFLLVLLFSSFPFWYPEQAWGSIFLLFIFTEFLGGGMFPLDILPKNIQNILSFTPFPHLLFSPIQIYLGKLELGGSLKALSLSMIWVIILAFFVNKLWERGLKNYKSEGK
ncbi:MAG: ABC-2 family transporter protein [Patescibacteria group bacterium]